MSNRRLRMFWVKALLLVIVCFAAMPVSAIQPIQVAVLPLVNTAKYPYVEDIQIIQNAIKQPFKYPYYSLIPPDTVLATTQTYLTQNKNTRLTDEKSLAQIAGNLSADLVVLVELSRVRLDSISSFWDGETYIESDIVLKCYAYSALLKRYDVISAVKFEREPQSIDTNTDVIFKDLSGELLIKLPYKRIPLTGFEKPDLLSTEENPLE